jgi:cytochrome b involved in lipid metabolism
MSFDLEIGVHDNSVSTTDAASAQDQFEKIRKQVAILQGIERGISKNSRTLTVQKADSLNGTAQTGDSLNFSRRDSFQKPEEPDETVQKIRKEVARLQNLQKGLVGGSKSSKTLRTSASSMSLTPEQFEKQQKYTRTRKYSAIALGVLILVGVVASIVSLVGFLQDKDVSFVMEKGGNTPSTLQDVALHATTDDCWAEIHGNVYDLTDWVDDHPGGSIYIESICGKEGTYLFSTHHRSSFLNEYVARYRVGPLAAATQAPQVVESFETGKWNGMETLLLGLLLYEYPNVSFYLSILHQVQFHTTRPPTHTRGTGERTATSFPLRLAPRDPIAFGSYLPTVRVSSIRVYLRCRQ